MGCQQGRVRVGKCGLRGGQRGIFLDTFWGERWVGGWGVNFQGRGYLYFFKGSLLIFVHFLYFWHESEDEDKNKVYFGDSALF